MTMGHPGASGDEAIGVLFSVDPDTGESSCDVIRESDYANTTEPGHDPITRCENLMRGIRDDFPTRLWTFTGNERARELRSATLLAGLGLK